MNKIEKLLEDIFTNSQNKLSIHKIDNKENESSALKNLIYSEFEKAALFLNNKYEFKLIEIFQTPASLLSLLFNIDNGRGFLISFGKSKLVLVLLEEQNFLTFVGRTSDSINKNIKLLRLTIFDLGNGNYTLKDNSGMNIDIYEVISVIMKWGVY